MTIIENREEFFKHHKKEGGRILEVTIKRYYVIPSGESMSTEDIKKEWFEEYANQSHAYKDASRIGGGDKVVNVKEL